MNELMDDDEIVLKVEKDPLIGQKLGGRYEILSVLGRGGMGVVYKAHQADIDRFVAIKTLHVSRVIDRDTIKRFQSEAQAVSRVRHPHTVMVYDFGVSEGGVPYLVMELLEGTNFRDLLKQQGPLSLARANFIFQQVFEALAFAHDSGIVHRDMKPENIMLSQKGEQEDWVFVLDFGIAGMMGSDASQQIVGSPPYMSPEQCSMKEADPRSDLYSLAICLFEALSGRLPYQARSAMEIIECHVSGQPKVLKDLDTNTSTLESISQVILKAMEKRPEKRYQSAREFAADLEEAVGKDSKRGLALRHRVGLDAPRANEFVETRKDVLRELSGADETEARRSEKKGIVSGIQSFLHGDAPVEKAESSNDRNETSDKNAVYLFLNCPHCNAPTEEGLALCLSCGRSLASKGDYSKIRAAKGEFSLPKYQEMKPEAPLSSKGFSQRTRNAMIQGGRVWTRTSGLMVVSLILIVCVFIVSGGLAYVSKLLPGSPSSQEGDSLEDNARSSEPASGKKSTLKESSVKEPVKTSKEKGLQAEKSN
ncbi:MAG: serine/threonine protein kinase [Candidatus Obscuribacterales bacterium]|nr:serine/threonine protein kinase [Candidatus Obscuribacterales bacterium]